MHAHVLETLHEKTSLLPENYSSLSYEEKIDALCSLQPVESVQIFKNEIEKDDIIKNIKKNLQVLINFVITIK